jgi:hypothetical protein
MKDARRRPYGAGQSQDVPEARCRGSRGHERGPLPTTQGVRWSLDFGQVVKLGSPFGEDGPYDGQAEAVFG